MAERSGKGPGNPLQPGSTPGAASHVNGRVGRHVNHIEALRAVHDRGAHLALMSPSKRPVHRGWLENPAPRDDVLEHAARGGLIGLKPQSIGFVVVDVDRGDPEAVIAAMGEPVVRVPSRTAGRWHLYYSAPSEPVGNWSWEMGGELRGANGAIVLWDPGAVAVAHVNGADVLDVAKLRGRPERPKLTGPEAVRAAPKGARNNTLFGVESGRGRKPTVRNCPMPWRLATPWRLGLQRCPSGT